MSAKLLLAGKLVAAAVLVVVGLVLLRVHSDRQYISLAPTEGIPHGVVLQPGESYSQTFIATRTTLTRLGLFLRPIPNLDGREALTLELRRGNQPVAAQLIPAAFINAQDATQVRFEPPVQTTLGEKLTFVVSIPSALAGQVRAQQREPDKSFSDDNVAFFIDGQQQPAPLAYQAYYDYRSPFGAQVGSLLFAAAFLLLAWPWHTHFPNLFIGGYLVLVAVLAIIPRLFISPIPWMLFLVQLAALGGMYALARRRGMSKLPALLAAQVFALTSWWPLHLLRDWRQMQLIVPRAAALKDIWLDTYQVASSIKVPGGASWDHYGSYIGIIATLLALIGLLTTAKKQWRIAVVGILGLVAAQFWPIIPHAVILTTFAMAYFAGWGLQQLGKYLHPYGRLAMIILVILVLLSLLDMLYVLAGPLEYGILSQEQIWKS